MTTKTAKSTEVGYLIVGAGACGLAFAHTLLSESDATIAIVDERHAPGGHWSDAYGFVRSRTCSACWRRYPPKTADAGVDPTGNVAARQRLPEMLRSMQDSRARYRLGSDRVVGLHLDRQRKFRSNAMSVA